MIASSLIYFLPVGYQQMLGIVNENLIEAPEIRFLGLAFLLWVSMYSINWVCNTLYNNNKCDIFNLFKKKKKKKS